MVNIQSLKTKELQVSELFDDHAIDVLILTETWLSNKENDKNWLEVTGLNKDNTSLYIHNRSNGHGGGLAFMCKSEYRVKLLKKGNTPSYEYATWELTVKNRSLMIIESSTHHLVPGAKLLTKCSQMTLHNSVLVYSPNTITIYC